MSNMKHIILTDENSNLNNPKNPFLIVQKNIIKEKNLNENIKKDKSNDIEKRRKRIYAYYNEKKRGNYKKRNPLYY